MNLTDQFPLTKPFVIEGKEEAILMLHGFTSAPNVFRDFAQYLSKTFGYEIHVPLLPGHGLTDDKLTETKKEDWIKFAEDEFLKVSSRCKKVHVMGLSMGGTLAAHLSCKFPDLVQSVTLFSPALYVKGWWQLVLPYIQFLPKNILINKKHRKKQDRWNDRASYQTFSYASIAEFDSLCRYVKREYRADVPMRVFIPVKDEVVDPESGKWFNDHNSNGNSDVIELTRSPHIVFMGDENEKIYKKVQEFLSSLI